jgi:hypothetical protein
MDLYILTDGTCNHRKHNTAERDDRDGTAIEGHMLENKEYDRD